MKATYLGVGFWKEAQVTVFTTAIRGISVISG